MGLLIYDAKSATHLMSCGTAVDVDGTFYAGTGLPDGTYDVYLYVNGFLGRKFNDVKVLRGEFTGLNATLINGDINNDNVVGQADLEVIYDNYYLSTKDSVWERINRDFITPKMCDLNCDGVVDPKDKDIVMKNWERKGDSYPKCKEAAPKKQTQKKGRGRS